MLDEPLQEAVEVLRAAFPEGAGADYAALLAVLYDELSEENLGLVVEEFAGVDRHLAVHDAVEFVTRKRPAAGDVARVREALAAHGWTED